MRGLAHRGYSGRYPENTIAAFKAAIDLKFSHIELDVHLTKDGVPVVFHDPVVDRMTDGTGKVVDYTLQQLQQLRIAGVERIPTLEEVLRLAKGKAVVEVELKTYGRQDSEVERAVLETVRQADMLREVFIASFDHYAVERVRALESNVELGLIMEGLSRAVFPYMRELGAKYLSLSHSHITEAYLQQCRQEAVQLIVWTVNDETAMRRFLPYPNVMICTDELELWRQVAGSE